MRYSTSMLLLLLAACSVGTMPDVTPTPRQEPSPAPPPAPTDTARPATPPAETPAPDKAWRGSFTYRCAGDRVIETNYADDGTVEVRWNGRWYTLRPQQAASGALYTNSTLRWHTRGSSAMLEERGQTVASECSVR